MVSNSLDVQADPRNSSSGASEIFQNAASVIVRDLIRDVRAVVCYAGT
jgi:hypothetical protein